ncbi:Phage tail collar domain containing protein [uncultured Caudovirales phage]|uniref:Phage tail collar domain containing protein n=1 Tax=uncultured Caudovirales phage TaxID=2100421 RepID=A0A6J5QPP2_9CAUD|nr:Phage tail collar domain containing protein [uncultured Caudovirales phage]CAB4199235.1 Phage tail collar domain containing protein [uncultured Caudovirales phage]
MTVSGFGNTGTVTFVPSSTAEYVAHSLAISGSTGNVSSGGTVYTSGYYNATTFYQTTWENPIAVNTLSKYLTSIPAADSKKIVALLEDNARSLEDHLNTGYLKVSGGTVYGPTTLAGDIFLFGSVIVEDKPLISLLPPTGSITLFGGATTPAGWLLCDGTAISRTDYAYLFSIIGSNFGAGNGSTTFNLPNLTSKFPLGSTGTPGTTGGSSTVTIASGNLPTHTHTLNAHTHSMDAHTHNLQNHTHDIDGIDFTDHTHTYKTAATATAGTSRAIITNSGSGSASGGINDGGISGTVGSSAPSTNDSGTASSASTLGPSDDATGNGGFTNTALTIPTPPYVTVRYIIKT